MSHPETVPVEQATEIVAAQLAAVSEMVADFVAGKNDLAMKISYSEWLKEPVVAALQAAAERERVLRDALQRILAAPMIDHKNPENGVYGIARQALGESA